MKKLTILAFILVLFCYSNALADYRRTLPKSSIVCFEKHAFEEIKTAIYNNDNVAYKYMMKAGCMSVKPGIRISVLDTSFFNNYAKIRLYSGKITVIGWTFLENIIER